jgi:hypothetical protein
MIGPIVIGKDAVVVGFPLRFQDVDRVGISTLRDSTEPTGNRGILVRLDRVEPCRPPIGIPGVPSRVGDVRFVEQGVKGDSVPAVRVVDQGVGCRSEGGNDIVESSSLGTNPCIASTSTNTSLCSEEEFNCKSI